MTWHKPSIGDVWLAHVKPGIRAIVKKLLREAPIGRVNRAYVQLITSYLEF